MSDPGGKDIINQFEAEIADYWGVRYALCTPNGTAAIHSGLFGCGVGPGDEVIVQSYTHPFSVVPIFAVGGVPVFADIDPETLSIDPEDIERKITPKTKAIVPVLGIARVTDIKAIMAVARRHGLKVVEDSCTTFGEKVDGKRYGTFGDAGNLSLQTSKMLGSGEGGVLFTDDPEIHSRATLLGHYERVRDLPDARYRELGNIALGYKFRMSPLHAAIARIKLKHIERRLARWSRNLNRIYDALCELDCFKRPTVPDWFDAPFPPWHIHYNADARDGIPIDALVDAVRAEGASVTGPALTSAALHLNPTFTKGRDLLDNAPSLNMATDVARSTYGPGSLPVTESIVSRGREQDDRITFPCLAHVSDEIVYRYIDAFLKVAGHVDELKAARS